MITSSLFATTREEAAVAITVLVAIAALAMLVVWQLFGLARRALELRAQRQDAAQRVSCPEVDETTRR